MPAYLMGIIEAIHDQEMFQRYVDQVGPVVAQYGGRYLFVAPRIESIEGALRPAIVAALEFDDAAALEFDDAAVQGLRQRSTRSNVLFADSM